MGTILIILIIFFVVLPLAQRLLLPLLRRYAARKAEDMLRRSMGMPPRSEARKEKRTAQAADPFAGQRTARSRRSARRRDDGPIIPPEYAEDVEFVEIKEFDSSGKLDGDDIENVSYTSENQVTDAEWEEIRK